MERAAMRPASYAAIGRGRGARCRYHVHRTGGSYVAHAPLGGCGIWRLRKGAAGGDVLLLLIIGAVDLYALFSLERFPDWDSIACLDRDRVHPPIHLPIRHWFPLPPFSFLFLSFFLS